MKQVRIPLGVRITPDGKLIQKVKVWKSYRKNNGKTIPEYNTVEEHYTEETREIIEGKLVRTDVL